MPFCRAAVHWQRLAYLLQFSQESPGRCVTPYFPGDFFMLFGSGGNICRFKTGFGCKKILGVLYLIIPSKYTIIKFKFP